MNFGIGRLNINASDSIRYGRQSATVGNGAVVRPDLRPPRSAAGTAARTPYCKSWRDHDRPADYSAFRTIG